MDKNKMKKEFEKIVLNPVNSITHKKKVENQNQEHNVKDEGIQPKNERY